MDVTIDYKLDQIRKSFNKSHWRTRKFIEDVNIQISNYRFLAYKLRGTYVARFCSRESNFLEEKLHSALGIKNDRKQ